MKKSGAIENKGIGDGGVDCRITNYRFLLNVQRFKMNELWDNSEDECWEFYK